MNSRNEQKERRKQQILQAALELFVKKGFTATKTSEISKAANVSEGLLFHYFESKDKLYEELIKIAMDRSSIWMEIDADSPIEFFQSITEEIFSMLLINPKIAYFFVLMARAQRDFGTPESVMTLLEGQNARYERTVALIIEGQRLGQIRGGNPEALTWAFWCSIQGIVEQIAIHEDTPFPVADWIISILKKEEQKDDGKYGD